MAAVRSVGRKPQSLQFVQSIYSAAHQNKYAGNIDVIQLKISLLQECRFLRYEALCSGRSLTTFLGKCTILLRVKVIVDFYFEVEGSKFFHNVEKFLPFYAVSNITRQYSSSGPNCHIFVFITPQIMRTALPTAHNNRCKC
jgi:hypothetical protein